MRRLLIRGGIVTAGLILAVGGVSAAWAAEAGHGTTQTHAVAAQDGKPGKGAPAPSANAQGTVTAIQAKGDGSLVTLSTAQGTATVYVTSKTEVVGATPGGSKASPPPATLEIGENVLAKGAAEKNGWIDATVVVVQP